MMYTSSVCNKKYSCQHAQHKRQRKSSFAIKICLREICFAVYVHALVCAR